MIAAYSIGACVGRGSVVGVGSVVGFGVGAGDEGEGVTVFGPALLSVTRALSPGKNEATKTITAIAQRRTARC